MNKSPVSCLAQGFFLRFFRQSLCHKVRDEAENDRNMG